MQNYVVGASAPLYQYQQAIAPSIWHSALVWGKSNATRSTLLKLVRFVGTPHSLLARSTFNPLNPICATNETQGALLDQLHHQAASAHIVTATTGVTQQDKVIS
jgi:hypothetical protein